MKSLKRLKTGRPSRASVLGLVMIAVIIVGNAVSWLTQKEYWPFSGYPMYAKLPPQEGMNLRLVALRGRGELSGGPEEVQVEPKSTLYPFDSISLYESLHRVVVGGSLPKIQLALDRLRILYIAGEGPRPSDKPRTRGLMLYADKWRVESRSGVEIRVFTEHRLIAQSIVNESEKAK